MDRYECHLISFYIQGGYGILVAENRRERSRNYENTLYIEGLVESNHIKIPELVQLAFVFLCFVFLCFCVFMLLGRSFH
jgi:hypothetical protein